ncbi:MAG TPA: P-loop NTPase [Candidatus Bathyarchaeia archaeon]|nr:P-loop NTPase [Candidatus Bathyarchaeia archaeon]
MKTICVTSLKGGSGKSTFSLLLAKALSQKGYKVAFFDADISSSSFSEFSGQKFKENSIKIDSETKKMLPFLWVHDENNAIQVIATSMLTGNENAVVGEDMSQFVNDVLNFTQFDEDTDYLILDLPAGLGNIYLSITETLLKKKQHLGDIIISVPSQRDALKKVVKFTKSKSKVLGIVTNFSEFTCPECKNHYSIFGKEIAEQIAEEYQVDFIGSIPLTLDFSQKNNGGILPHEVPDEFKDILEKSIRLIEKSKVFIHKTISTGKLKKIIQEQVAKILIDLIVLANNEISVGKKYYNQFPFENTCKLFILNEEFKPLNIVHLKLDQTGIKVLKNEQKEDFQLKLTYRTLARIIMQQFKDDIDGNLYPYSVIDAWRNRDIHLSGDGSTQRMIEFFNRILSDSVITELMKRKAKIIEGWI